MIGRLTGKLIVKAPPDICVDVQGVGYELQVPMNTYYQLPEIDHGVVLFTHLVVREDAQLLYGFIDEQQRTLFRALIKISGVGPKLALAILSGMNASEFVRVVTHDDAAALERLPGIGKKTAERLIIEMRDKLKNWEIADGGATGQNPVAAGRRALEEAESALIALGYKQKEAQRAIKSVAQEDMSSQNLIRQALSVI